MRGLHWAILALFGMGALALVGCDSISGTDESSGAPKVKDGTEYVFFDDGGNGSLNSVTLGANDFLVRTDGEDWVAEDADGVAQFWGTVTALPSGFQLLEITKSKLDDPPKGLKLIALEISEGVMFVMATDSFDSNELAFLDEDSVGINFDGGCPANGTGVYNFTNTAPNPTDTSVDITTDVTYGTASLITSGGTTSINAAEETLDNDLGALGGETQVATGFECSGGLAEESTSGEMIMFPGAGFIIVQPESGGGVVGLVRNTSSPLTMSDVSANGMRYAGVVQGYDTDGTPRVVPIAVEGKGSDMLYGAPYESVADIVSDTIDLTASNPFLGTINLFTAGGIEEWFDAATIASDTTEAMRTMAMTLPNGKIMVIALIWNDEDTNGTASTGDTAELVVLVEQ